MKKILVIGDIHGNDIWKEIVAQNQFDVCVFLGDYFDDWDIPVPEQIENFKNILAFKKEHNDRVVLLLGNHDYHYLVTGERYSGYNAIRATDIREVLNQNHELLQFAWGFKNYLFTHAGLTKTWAERFNVPLSSNAAIVAHAINEVPLSAFAFARDGMDPSGDDKVQGPTWVRPTSLVQDKPDNLVQVVGHTTVTAIQNFKEANVFLCDALRSNEFMQIIVSDKAIKTFFRSVDFAQCEMCDAVVPQSGLSRFTWRYTSKIHTYKSSGKKFIVTGSKHLCDTCIKNITS